MGVICKVPAMYMYVAYIRHGKKTSAILITSHFPVLECEDLCAYLHNRGQIIWAWINVSGERTHTRGHFFGQCCTMYTRLKLPKERIDGLHFKQTERNERMSGCDSTD